MSSVRSRPRSVESGQSVRCCCPMAIWWRLDPMRLMAIGIGQSGSIRGRNRVISLRSLLEIWSSLRIRLRRNRRGKRWRSGFILKFGRFSVLNEHKKKWLSLVASWCHGLQCLVKSQVFLVLNWKLSWWTLIPFLCSLSDPNIYALVSAENMAREGPLRLSVRWNLHHHFLRMYLAVSSSILELRPFNSWTCPILQNINRQIQWSAIDFVLIIFFQKDSKISPSGSFRICGQIHFWINLIFSIGNPYYVTLAISMLK